MLVSNSAPETSPLLVCTRNPDSSNVLVTFDLNTLSVIVTVLELQMHPPGHRHRDLGSRRKISLLPYRQQCSWSGDVIYLQSYQFPAFAKSYVDSISNEDIEQARAYS
jgi:hypothetical protein